MRKAGVNGIAGRIGKFFAFGAVKQGIRIAAANELAGIDEIVFSLAHKDSVHGNLDWEVKKVGDHSISINGNLIRISHEKDPANIYWGNDVGVVAECAGPFTERSAAERHFNKNRRLENVLLSAPGKGEMYTLVMGVNHTDYVPGTEKGKVISNASCTTKALAMPLIVLIEGGIKIYSVLMDTTHSYTNKEKGLDFMGQYGALDSIVSAKTGAAIATGQVITILEGLMDGFAMRVPTRDGSFANFYLVAEGEDLSPSYLNGLFIKAAANVDRYLGRIITFDGVEIAIPDILGETANSVMALSKTKSKILPFAGRENPDNQVAHIGGVSGYDNEIGPATDLAMLGKYILKQNELYARRAV